MKPLTHTLAAQKDALNDRRRNKEIPNGVSSGSTVNQADDKAGELRSLNQRDIGNPDYYLVSDEACELGDGNVDKVSQFPTLVSFPQKTEMEKEGKDAGKGSVSEKTRLSDDPHNQAPANDSNFTDDGVLREVESGQRKESHSEVEGSTAGEVRGGSSEGGSTGDDTGGTGDDVAVRGGGAVESVASNIRQLTPRHQESVHSPSNTESIQQVQSLQQNEGVTADFSDYVTVDFDGQNVTTHSRGKLLNYPRLFDPKFWKVSRIKPDCLIRRFKGYDISETEYGVSYLYVVRRFKEKGVKRKETSADFLMYEHAGYNSWRTMEETGKLIKGELKNGRKRISA